jgi:heme O synthase-like polyprenyltransferase
MSKFLIMLWIFVTHMTILKYLRNFVLYICIYSDYNKDRKINAIPIMGLP